MPLSDSEKEVMFMGKDLRPLSTGEAAVFCHVSQVAIYKWIKEGKLKAYKTPGNHHRVQIVDFIKFLKKYGMPIPEELLTQSKPRILIVDDEPGVIGFITRILQDMEEDYQIASALDGYAAGEKVTSFHPDLIILDLRMPGLDGFEVCQRIKANPETKNIKVLAITGYAEVENVQKIIQYGAQHCLVKPILEKELRAQVAKFLPG